MNIQFETPERLKIQLSATDLSELGTSYTQLDYASPQTRKIIDDLLTRIGAKESFNLSDRRLVIEILPAEKEGCVIYLTLVVSAKRRHREAFWSVWELVSADELIDGLVNLKDVSNKISLYRFNDRYRLVFQCDRQGAVQLILTEYGCKIGGKSAALHTAEHGQLLSADIIADFSRHKRP
jgi:negative regulator of genetic competence, sporulation and motility